MTEKLRDNIITGAKGFSIGASMSLPGISGGTMAVILDVYDRLVLTVSGFVSRKKFKENFRNNFLFILIFAISGAAGMLLLSRLLLYVTELFPVPMHFLFIGAVLGSVPLLYIKTGIKRFSVKPFLYAAAGVAFVFIIDLIPKLPENCTDIGAGFSPLTAVSFLASGICLAVALILPGISFSHMLIVLGIYEKFYTALQSFDMVFLCAIGICTVIGLAALIKIMAYAMEKYPSATYAVIIGFVLGSVKDIYIGLPAGWDIPASIFMLIGGFILVYALSFRNKESTVK